LSVITPVDLANSPLRPPLLMRRTYTVFGFRTLKLLVNIVGVAEP